MKKNIIYVLAALTIVIAVILILRDKKESVKIPDEQDFAVEDVSQISRIVLTDRQKTKADLRKEDGYWNVNGKFRAMQPKVDVLLETMKKVRVHAPVSNARLQGALKEIDEQGVKVELFRKGESKPFKVYHVGGSTEDSKGTYMLFEYDGKRAERPFIMHLPGFDGLLDVRYFTDENEWRDTGAFSLSLEQIAQVSLEYPGQPEHSFVITAHPPDSFSVVNPARASAQQKIFKDGVVRYLSSFSFLNVETFDNDNPVKDSVISTTPHIILTVSDIEGYSKQMKVYLMPVSKRSKLQFNEQGDKIPYDLDRFFALVNDGKDFAIIQNFVFGKVFLRYDDFVRKQ